MGEQTSISLADITSKYVGQSFAACPCMQLAHGWYTDIGIFVPDSFGGLNLKNYFQAWEKDRKHVVSIMIDLFNSLGEPVADLSRLERHDLLAVEEDGNIYAAIYLGGGMAIKSHLDAGVMVFFVGKMHRVTLARRLLCQL